MPFVSGTYQRFYGSTGWTDDKNAAVFILASRHDTHDQDIADGINTAVGKIRLGDTMILSSVSGTNTVLGSLTPALTAYAYGLRVILTPANTNTGATTLNINSLGALAVLNVDGTACVGGELAATIPAELLLNSAANAWIIVNLANQGLVIPITAANGNLTIAAGHLGRCVEYNGGGGHTYTFPVLANGGVVGVDNASNFTISIAVSGTSLFWQNGAGGTVASPRTLAAGGSASMQFSTNTGAWKLKGAGIS